MTIVDFPTRPTPSRTFKFGAIFVNADGTTGVIAWTRTQSNAETLCRISAHATTGVTRLATFEHMSAN